MGKPRFYHQKALEAARALQEGGQSLEIGKFSEFPKGTSVNQQLYAALHDERFTLTEISQFLENHGYRSTVDKLRRLRRLMFTFNISQPADGDPTRHIDIHQIRLPTWITKKDDYVPIT